MRVTAFQAPLTRPGSYSGLIIVYLTTNAALGCTIV